MVSTKLRAWAGVICLVGGGLGELLWYVVSPLDHSAKVADQVTRVGAHLGAMRAALWVDVLVILMIPAVLYIGYVAGARTSRLAAAGTVLAFVPAVAAEFLILNDVLIYEAAKQPDAGTAAALVKAYQDSPLTSTLTLLYLLCTVVGFIMLGIALLKARTIPVWAAVALLLYPVVLVVGGASGAVAVSLVANALALVGMAACAVALLRSTGDRSGPSPQPRTSLADSAIRA